MPSAFLQEVRLQTDGNLLAELLFPVVVYCLRYIEFVLQQEKPTAQFELHDGNTMQFWNGYLPILRGILLPLVLFDRFGS
jgi:hypothetical protein